MRSLRQEKQRDIRRALVFFIGGRNANRSFVEHRVRFAVILVTGAAGKTGLAVIRALTRKGQTVRALVRRENQVARLQALGVQDLIVGDMLVPTTLEQAVRGVRAIYHICPNVSPAEIAIGESLISSAHSAGIEFLVYHSVLHPQTEAMPHHWNKLRVEAAIFESGLSYTILQPASYMQNILANWETIIQQGVYYVPYALEARLSIVDLEDVAEAASVVLTEAVHAGATYELAGPEALSQTEVAEVLSRHVGRPVRVERVRIEEWAKRSRASGMGEYQLETLVKMFRYYENYGFRGNPRVLSNLLGRMPNTFEAFVERVVRQGIGA